MRVIQHNLESCGDAISSQMTDMDILYRACFHTFCLGIVTGLYSGRSFRELKGTWSTAVSNKKTFSPETSDCVDEALKLPHVSLYMEY